MPAYNTPNENPLQQLKSQLESNTNLTKYSKKMGATYNVLGRAVPSHYLAIATIVSVVFVAAPKPWNNVKLAHPPINAASPEEEKYVKEYLAKHAEKH